MGVLGKSRAGSSILARLDELHPRTCYLLKAETSYKELGWKGRSHHPYNAPD